MITVEKAIKEQWLCPAGKAPQCSVSNGSVGASIRLHKPQNKLLHSKKKNGSLLLMTREQPQPRSREELLKKGQLHSIKMAAAAPDSVPASHSQPATCYTWVVVEEAVTQGGPC